MNELVAAGMAALGGIGALTAKFVVTRVLARGARAVDERERDFREALTRLIEKADEMQLCQVEMRRDLAELRKRVRSFSALRRRVDGVANNHRKRIERLEAWMHARRLKARKKREPT